jgi:metallo-beta-lactamase family protein
MLSVECLGGVRSVTGSSFLLKARETSVLVDCGLFQGGRQIERRNYQSRLHRPSEVEYLLLTHAHIDHSGLIPKLVKDGFRGTIIASRQTTDLCGVMLVDSGHIQEMDAEWQDRKRRRQGKKGVEPLYSVEDARRSLTYFRPVERHEKIRLSDSLEMRFQNAGHILGSSILELWARDGEQPAKIVFSGDLGRRNQAIIKDPETIFDADYLFVESTYGDRDHKSAADSEIELLDAITSACRQGEKVIIPAFAVERTQELLYILAKLHRRGLLPDIPVYLDSPLAIAVTKVFRKHPRCFDEEMRQLIEEGHDPLNVPNLVFTQTPAESMEINRARHPAIVIAGSGMCNAGRIKHHLKHNLWRPGASLVFVGFQAEGTPGRLIIDGARQVCVFGEPVAVRAKVYTIGGFSAHADQRELLEWVQNFKNPRLQVFVVHGEEKASLAFARLIRERLKLSVRVPDFMEKLILGPPEAVVAAAAPVEAAAAGPGPVGAPQGLLGALSEMEARLKRIKDWVLATRLDAEAPDPRNQERLEEINRRLEELSKLLVYVEKR